MSASKSMMSTEFKVEITKQIQHVMPEMHYHDFYEIYIQDVGTREDIVNSQYFQLNPHDVLLLKPNTLHQAISKEAFTRTIIYFTDDYLIKFFSQEQYLKLISIFQTLHLRLTTEEYYRITSIVKELSKEDYTHCDNLIFLKLADILMLLLNHIKMSATTLEEVETSNIRSTSPLVAYINENYLSFQSIDEIAGTFYITPSHLCRKFKQITGYTITEYINSLKIQKACQLLHKTDQSITAIAEACGYNTSIYFCETFKKLLHVTPLEYRKRIKS